MLVAIGIAYLLDSKDILLGNVQATNHILGSAVVATVHIGRQIWEKQIIPKKRLRVHTN